MPHLTHSTGVIFGQVIVNVVGIGGVVHTVLAVDKSTHLNPGEQSGMTEGRYCQI